MTAQRRSTAVVSVVVACLGLGLAGCGRHTASPRSVAVAVAAPEPGCTDADLHSPGRASMPAPTRLTVVETFPTATVTLSPPAPDDQPSVPAQLAWDNALAEKRSDAHYELVLARMAARFPATMGPAASSSPLYDGVLVWAVISRHIPVVPSYNAPPVPGRPAPAARCSWADGLDPTDAVTGQRLFSDTFGSGR